MRKLSAITLAAIVGSFVLLTITPATAQAHTLKVCSANMSPKAELKCGKNLRHQHLCAARWIRNHTHITSGSDGVRIPMTAEWRSHLKFHLWMTRRARQWITEAHHRLQKSRLGVFLTGNVPQLICQVFGSACSMAQTVAYRESRYSIYAANGQYLGIFQMGEHERATYATIGYSTAYEQIVAAHNYFMVSGWSPWSQTAY